MEPLLYWILFCVLVSLLVIFASCIVFNIIIDTCLIDPEDIGVKINHLSGDDETNDECRLNKYQFDKDDVENLTRIQGDFKTVLPNIICVNEAEDTHIEKLIKRKESFPRDTLNSSLSNIKEEDALRHSKEDINSVVSANFKLIDGNVPKTFKEKKKISRSVDDLEFCDPKSIDILKSIHVIKERAQKVEEELDYFIASPNNVKFYEINEHFLRLMISLCDLLCETDELRKKKSETLEYIESCQKKLKDKAKAIL